MDVVAVAEAAEEAVAEVRAAKGPLFLECLTYRFRAHSMFDAELYREKTEVAEWKQKDPLAVLKMRAETAGLWPQMEPDELEEEVAAIVDEAVVFAENGTLEPVADLEKFVYSEEVVQ
jgi:TPP-dependent pyruvate/acetoin dehydrogenase alpha subunit